MGRPIGGTNKEWSKEEKYKYVHLVLDGSNSINGINKEFGISTGMVCEWVKRYKQGGVEALENKRKELSYVEQLEYEIVQVLSEKYNLKSLNSCQLNQMAIKEEIVKIRENHKAYGYRTIAANIRNRTGWMVTDNLVHKCCKELKIRSMARKTYVRAGIEHLTYKNIINNNWHASRPFEIVATDTTLLYNRYGKLDWRFYLDTFNNEIVGSDVRLSKAGNGITNHMFAIKDCLNNKIKRGYKELGTIIHSDQGSVYSSQKAISIIP